MRILETLYLWGLSLAATILLAACGGGGGGGETSQPVSVACAVNSVTCDETAHAVSASVGTQGATLTSPSGGVQLLIPLNALTSTTTISIAPSTEPMTQGNLGTPLQFGPDGTTFAVPIVLRMKYDPAMLPEGMQASELTISMATPNGWVAVPTTVDQTKKELVASLAHFTTYAAVPISSANFGTEVGRTRDGVAVYSNGANDHVSDLYNESNAQGYNTGLKWQCVEFVNRYYLEKFGKQIRIVGENANLYFRHAADRGLTSHENGGSEAPKVGDIIVSEGSAKHPEGHVAIVQSVGADRITVVHQNWTNGRSDALGRDLAFNKATNKVAAFNSTYAVRGWVRVPESTPAATKTFEPELSADGVRIELPSSGRLIRFSAKSVMTCTNGPGTCNAGSAIEDFVGGSMSSSAQSGGLVNVTISSKTGALRTAQYDTQMALVKDFSGCTYEPRVQMAAAIPLNTSFASPSQVKPVIVTKTCADGSRTQANWYARKFHATLNGLQSTTWAHDSYDLSGKWLSQMVFSVSVDTAGTPKVASMLLMSLYDYQVNQVFDVTVVPN